MTENIKVEIGQKWSLCAKNHVELYPTVSDIGLIVSVVKYKETENIAAKLRDLNGSYIFMSLNKDHTVMHQNLWTYVSNLIVCENCNGFCKQRCAR